MYDKDAKKELRLNPFEVREVLQDHTVGANSKSFQVSIPLKSGRCCKIDEFDADITSCLNPFEVREVLQASKGVRCNAKEVSIPLKSGRCCKNGRHETRPSYEVSIPLKSGRCCKPLWAADGRSR